MTSYMQETEFGTDESGMEVVVRKQYFNRNGSARRSRVKEAG